MRDIEFRAKQADSNKWVYGYYVNQENKHIIFEKDTNWHYYIDKKTIGQYFLLVIVF